ncbi:hypothetical protein BC749_10737 [Flavobacterium araucananum]|uniref:Uncharacterized protein n=1 Tax=Flavobacterium araucananum TaxID=946678 RepID=A0A227NLP4_9FLAO|nr:hypothetical protein [Flavobacterium araucananum]OXE98662.1 hypothetical protein B0A64_22470 [Flavobacterium araucananum]PWJ97241.1 hypothetical protein BC749_10737 [Flavobacterium araucananum]
MNFKSYLAGTIFWILLIWGPIEHSKQFWFAIRAGYLILIPLIIWLVLNWIWNRWQPNIKSEIILERILSGIICIALFVFAYFEGISTTHIGNTQQIQTRDGMEDVGEYVTLQGANWGNVFLLIILALLIFWYGVLKKGTKTP